MFEFKAAFIKDDEAQSGETGNGDDKVMQIRAHSLSDFIDTYSQYISLQMLDLEHFSEIYGERGAEGKVQYYETKLSQ